MNANLPWLTCANQWNVIMFKVLDFKACRYRIGFLSLPKKIVSIYMRNNTCKLIWLRRDSIEDKNSKASNHGADDYLANLLMLTSLSPAVRVIERRLGTAVSSVIKIKEVSLDQASTRG